MQKPDVAIGGLIFADKSIPACVNCLIYCGNSVPRLKIIRSLEQRVKYFISDIWPVYIAEKSDPAH